MAEGQPEGNKMVQESHGGLGREVDTLKTKRQTAGLKIVKSKTHTEC